MITKPFFITTLGLTCALLNACVSLPQPAQVPEPDTTPTSPPASVTTPAIPTPDALSPQPQPAVPHPPTSDSTEADTADKTQVFFQDVEPAFTSPEQAHLYQNTLYQLLLGELTGFKGSYAESAEYFLEVAQLTRQVDVAERAAQVALFAKDMDKVQQAARLWLELQPNNLEARQLLAVSLLRLERIGEATQQVEWLLNHQQGDIENSSKTLVDLLKQSGNHSTALKVVDTLIQRRPQDASLLYLYARLLMGAQKIPQAITQLSRLLTLQPEHEEAAPLYVQLLTQQDSLPQALRFLQKHLEQHPEHDAWRLMYARLLLNAERTEDAMVQFQQLLTQTPQNTELLYTLGLLNLQQKQAIKAKEHFLNLLNHSQLADEHNIARYFLGQTAELTEEDQEALKWYQQVEGGQHYFSANARIVFLHLDEKAYKQAMSAVENIAPGTPDEEYKLLQLEAEVYLRQKRHQEAMAVYQRGLDSDPDNVDLLYMRGMVAEKLDRLDILEADFRRILELEPNNINTLNALGYTLADRTDRIDEAYILIKQAYEQRPQAHHILDSMGWVLYRLQRYEESLEFLRQAMAAQEDPEIAAHLGEVLWHSGAKEEARAVLMGAKAQFPEDERLQKTILKLLPPSD